LFVSKYFCSFVLTLNLDIMENCIKSIDELHLLTINVGLALHNADWNWKNVNSPFTRLYYVTKGTAKVALPNSIIELRPNHLYLIPSFTTHSYICEGGFDHYYIHIYEDLESGTGFLDDLLFPSELPAGDLELALCKRLCEINPTLSLTQSNPAIYDNSSSLIQNIVKNKQRMLCDRVESRGIIYQLIARFLKEARTKVEVNDSRVLKSLAYIRKNINQPLNVEMLAEIACVSKDHFIRLFKKETGVTPIQYITQKKIEKAQLLLITEDLSVKEISFMLAYEDHSYFNKLFRKHTGVTPQEYRKYNFKK